MRASAENVFPGPLKKLEKLLWEWTWLNRKMVRDWGGDDCPWWYNERASISTLAGAVWNAGGTSLEEYASRKRKGSGNALGRCDLYFRIKQNDYVAEAKQCWLNAGSRVGDMKGNVQECLDVACKDAKQNRPDHHSGETLIGIVFIVPRIPPSEEDDVRQRIKAVQDVLKRVAGEGKCALAWIFPRDSINSLKAKDDGYTYPGTAILIKHSW